MQYGTSGVNMPTPRNRKVREAKGRQRIHESIGAETWQKGEGSPYQPW